MRPNQVKQIKMQGLGPLGQAVNNSRYTCAVALGTRATERAPGGISVVSSDNMDILQSERVHRTNGQAPRPY